MHEDLVPQVFTIFEPATTLTAPGSSYKGFRFPPEIISHCVWLYHRFPLSFGDVPELCVL